MSDNPESWGHGAGLLEPQRWRRAPALPSVFRSFLTILTSQTPALPPALFFKCAVGRG